MRMVLLGTPCTRLVAWVVTWGRATVPRCPWVVLLVNVPLVRVVWPSDLLRVRTLGLKVLMSVVSFLAFGVIILWVTVLVLTMRVLRLVSTVDIADPLDLTFFASLMCCTC